MRHFVATLYFSASARHTYLAAQSGAAPMPPSFAALRERHVAYLNELMKGSSLLCAGPTPDYRAGVLVLAAESETAARQLLAADPYMVEHVFERYELLEFKRHV